MLGTGEPHRRVARLRPRVRATAAGRRPRLPAGGVRRRPRPAARLLRPPESRVALSATLALRLVPVLAADAGRLAEAQRCRPGASTRKPGTRERLAVLEPPWPGPSSAPSTSRRCSRCAATRLRAGHRAGSYPLSSRPRLRRRGARHHAAGGGGRSSPLAPASTPTRC